MSIKHIHLIGQEDRGRTNRNKALRASFVPDKKYNIKECVEVFRMFQFGFPDDEAIAVYFPYFLVGQCFAFGQQYDCTKLITLPGRYTYDDDGGYTLIRDQIYDYGNAFMTQGYVWEADDRDERPYWEYEGKQEDYYAARKQLDKLEGNESQRVFPECSKTAPVQPRSIRAVAVRGTVDDIVAYLH